MLTKDRHSRVDSRSWAACGNGTGNYASCRTPVYRLWTFFSVSAIEFEAPMSHTDIHRRYDNVMMLTFELSSDVVLYKQQHCYKVTRLYSQSVTIYVASCVNQPCHRDVTFDLLNWKWHDRLQWSWANLRTKFAVFATSVLALDAGMHGTNGSSGQTFNVYIHTYS